MSAEGAADLYEFDYYTLLWSRVMCSKPFNLFSNYNSSDKHQFCDVREVLTANLSTSGKLGCFTETKPLFQLLLARLLEKVKDPL